MLRTGRFLLLHEPSGYIMLSSTTTTSNTTNNNTDEGAASPLRSSWEIPYRTYAEVKPFLVPDTSTVIFLGIDEHDRAHEETEPFRGRPYFSLDVVEDVAATAVEDGM